MKSGAGAAAEATFGEAQDGPRLKALRQKAHVQRETSIALPLELRETAGPTEDVAHVPLVRKLVQPLDFHRGRSDGALLDRRNLRGSLEVRRARHRARDARGGGGSLDREFEAEGAARADPAFHLDLASHQLHVPTTDRQPEPGTTAALSLGHLLERLENGFELIGGNP